MIEVIWRKVVAIQKLSSLDGGGVEITFDSGAKVVTGFPYVDLIESLREVQRAEAKTVLDHVREQVPFVRGQVANQLENLHALNAYAAESTLDTLRKELEHVRRELDQARGDRETTLDQLVVTEALLKEARVALDSLAGVRAEVRRFALAMEGVLRINDGRGSWRDDPIQELVEKFLGEVHEFCEALHIRCPESVVLDVTRMIQREVFMSGSQTASQKEGAAYELIDVANYCMMLYDRLCPDEGGHLP